MGGRGDRHVKLEFTRDGLAGSVTVTVERVRHAPSVGKPATTDGFPCCSAEVDYPALGYRAFFGWVQLVRSSDNTSRGAVFEMDPFALFEDATSPYAFFGFKPVLFDAPSRADRAPLTWLAHSFLAYTPLDAANRHVIPVAGFSWGFDIDDRGEIAIGPALPLDPADWDTHRHFLATTYPGWRFDGRLSEPPPTVCA